jgi:PAS domain S-box-containing protein
LHGLRGLFAAHPDVGQSGFRAYVEARELRREFPGVLGFGLIERVRPDDAATYAARVRDEGLPGFTLQEASGSADMFIARIAEPMASNAAVLGLNFGADPTVRVAIEQAVLGGDATMSARTQAQRGSGARVGLSIFVPIYHAGPATDSEDQRWRALRGLVFSSIDVAQALAGVTDIVDGRLDLEVFDGPATTSDRLLYDADGHLDVAGGGSALNYADRRFDSTRSLTIGGRAVAVRASTTPVFDAGFDRSLVTITWMSGGALTLLAAFAAWLLAAGRARVAQQVQAMTADLDRLAKVARHTSNAVIVTDASRRIVWVNEGFSRITGYGADEAIGRSPGAMLQFEGTDSRQVDRLRQSLMASQPFRGELLNRGKNGRTYWIDIEIQPIYGHGGELEGFLAIESDITDRKQFAETLARERARLASILAGIHAGDGEWNMLTGDIVISPRWAAMLGYTLESLWPVTAQTWSGLCHPDDLPVFLDAVREHVRGTTPQFNVEVRMRHQRGDWRVLDVRGSVSTRLPNGRAEWVSGTHIDVTERRQEARRWQARAELSSDWFWQTDAEHRICALDTERHEELGRMASVVLGRRRDEMPWISPPDGSDSWAGFHAMLDRHESFQGVVYAVRPPEGETRWFEIEGRPRRGDDGNFLGYDGVGRDVTERRRVTADLRESLSLIDALFEGIPVPVVMKDTECRYVRMNRAYADLFGVSAEQIVGKSAGDVIDAGAAARHDAEDRELLRSPGTRTYQVSQTLAGGRRLDALVCKSTLLAPDGRVLGLVGTMVDISDQKAGERAMLEARNAAEAANRAKSAFLATMSHEIRTPMNGVLGMAELLAHSDLDEEQAQTVHTVRESATALLRLIDDILDFSKIEAGRLELEHEPVELEPLVEGVCDGLSPMALDRKVGLHAFVDPRCPAQVLTDPVRLRQLINNLAGNAIKFSARDGDGSGRVSVRCRPEGTGLRLDVADNGIGMDDETLGRLFQPFTQAEVSTTRRFGGTGLGLAICRRLVEMMDGRLDVTSRPGEGSTFSVWLPVRSAQPAPTADDLQDLDCIVVDDGELPCEDLRAWLEHAGARVHRATDVQAGAALARGFAGQPVMLQSERPDGRNLMPAPADTDLRHLLIGRGRRAAARLVAPNTATLDQLRHQPLVRAVAMMAGRASPEAVNTRHAELAALPNQPAPSAEHARARGELILVAEDDATNRMVIRRQLALLGRAAEIVEDGHRALEAWRRGGHALLLTDLHMPGLDGYTLAATLRSDEASSGAARRPIVALTANALKGEATRARQAGMDDYLTKPVPLKQLAATLERWLPVTAAPWGDETSPSADVAAQPAVDLDVLRTMVGDDPQTMQELLVEYLRSARDQVAELRLAWRAGDHRHAGAIAHKLKSASRAVGAVELGDLCAALEKHRQGAEGGAAGVDLVHFERTFAAVVAQIDKHLEPSPP